MQINDLLQYLDALLEPGNYRDYAPNGLQVAGRTEVRSILTGVTASQALIDAAIERGADTLLVHHGYFWKGEDPSIWGIKQQRIKKLLQHDINLIAYHLPLDGHLTLGNNAQLGRLLEFTSCAQTGEQCLLWHGLCKEGHTAHTLSLQISQMLARPAQQLGRPDKPVKRVAWCTGGAQGFFTDAIKLNVDAFITGEVSEQHYHMSLEYDIAFIAAGHHATERYGVQALGEHLAGALPVQVSFIDVPNPV